jgi:glycosyltransferase involved in cell wall biosynthesis
VTEEAAARGVPVACFDTHRAAPSVREGAGFVVDYLDVVGMATGLLAIHEGERVPEAAEINARRRALYRRSVTTIGARLLELAGSGGAR